MKEINILSSTFDKDRIKTYLTQGTVEEQVENAAALIANIFKKAILADFPLPGNGHTKDGKATLHTIRAAYWPVLDMLKAAGWKQDSYRLSVFANGRGYETFIDMLCLSLLTPKR